MTVDRLALAILAFANGVCGVIAADPTGTVPPLVRVLSAAVVAGCGGVMVMLRSWGDAAPVPTESLPPHG